MVDTSKITILNVDDNESGLYTKSRILRRANYRVLEAQTGREALRLVQEANPQLVLLDVKLPDMHGFEVCRRIKAMPSVAQPMVLHISAAYIDKTDRVRALEGGADAYISEPIEAEELLANVKALLRLWQAEATIRESEERWAMAIQASGDAIWDCNLMTREVWRSETYLRRFGKEELDGQDVWRYWNERIHPEDRTRVIDSFHAAIADSNTTWSEEYRYRQIDGTYAEILDRATITRNTHGVATRILGSVLDLGEHKQRERQLRYYASLQENVSDAVIATDMESRIQSWNRAATAIYGWQAVEVMGKTVSEVLQTRYASDELPRREFKELFQQGYWQGEVVQRRKDGMELNILASVTILKDEYEIAYGLVAINHDITAQKQAHEALQLSEARYRLLADNVTDWVTRMNPRGEYIYVSPSTRTVLGYEPEELVGQWGYPFVHPEDQALVQEAHRNGLDHRFSSSLLVYRRQHKDGHYVWLETKTVAICSPETGEVLEFVASARDISERKRAEEILHTKFEEERAFHQYLKTLHEITIELTAIDQLDDFYRCVVELGLERLGFERLGLLFYDAERGLALGTYGTDAQGRVVAEHQLQFNPANLTSILQRALESPEHFTFDAEAQLFSNGELIGVGWNAAAALWNGQQSLGWLTADNGVHQRPLSKPLLDILPLYSLTVGTLLGRKQLEAALRKSEEKFRLLVEAAPLAIIISDASGRITLVNHCTEELFGYSGDELMAQSVDLLVPATVRVQHAANRAMDLSAPRMRRMGGEQALYARRKDGHEFPVEIELSYVATSTGLMMMSFILDISERKRAAEALRTQRDFLQLVIDSVPNLIAVKDRAGYFQLANEATAHLYGITPAAMLGKTDADLNPNLDEVAFFRQKDREVLDSGQPMFIPEQTILGRHYQTTKLSLKQATGQPDHLLVVSSDITARKQTEEALKQALARNTARLSP
ncbi:MAG: PAS domain S-box protein [Chloroflexi bacterium]|nr:PAS domain S-box protein [Chloroflexota bacterium]